MSNYQRAVYYQDNDFKLSVELVDGIPFIHLHLHKATKSILDKVLRYWAEVKALAWADGHEAIYTYTQDERMFRLFGAEKIPGKFIFKGNEYEVGKWELN